MDPKYLRNPYATHAARRAAGPMRHRTAPRGGARNASAELAADAAAEETPHDEWDEELLRRTVREALSEDLKNLGHRHERTSAGTRVLRRMHDAPGVLEALSQVDSPEELAHVIEAILDAVPVVRRADVLRALGKVTRHERATRR